MSRTGHRCSMNTTEEQHNASSNARHGPNSNGNGNSRRVVRMSSSQTTKAQGGCRIKERQKQQQKRGWVRQAMERSIYSKECIMAQKRAERSTGLVQQQKKNTTNKRSLTHRGDQSQSQGDGPVTKYRKSSADDQIDVAVSMDIESPEKNTYGWNPPVSPYGLLEEELYKDPWKLFVSCILLNKTSAVQVRQVIWDLFKEYPTPQDMIRAPPHELEQRIMPLGLYRKRAVTLQRLSREYISTDEWKDAPEILHGIGKYACDAYRIFCLGQWRHVTPEDKDLKKYIEFLERTEGVGVGFESTQGENE